ncbi:hypothetical protein HOK51_02555 [Candidatus Woesearchaeota archaeon]|jgi:hypothetical protein|nr:hypothetical protein [Candidatus Woesearchaeota archaeon]MBT6518699.1 hypothetical protein [Candidatus Woesearchaeota archaeon]MBT7368379.1 hypothetical protein [Candidatus Woesearchaeota archaeon]
MFKQKRGLTQPDWIISLGIFLIYIAWFFIFVNPLIPPQRNMETGFQIIKTGLSEDIYETVYEIPIFFTENVTNDYEPIIIDQYMSVIKNDSVLSSSYSYFELNNEKFMFLENISSTSYSTLYWPLVDTTTQQPSSFKPIISGNTVSAQGMKTVFSDYKISTVNYFGKTRLFNYQLYSDSNLVGNQGFSDNVSLVAKYVNQGEYLNHTTFIFGKNPRMYNYVLSSDNREHTFGLTTALSNYTYYYVSASEFGNIDYDNDDCETFETNFIDFNNGASGVAFVFQEDVTFQFCNNNTNINLDMGFDVFNETRYDIMFHQGDESNVIGYPIEVKYGIKQGKKWASLPSIDLLGQKTYAQLKSDWNFPSMLDFNITFTSLNYEKSIGTGVPNDKIDIYVEELKSYILEPDLEVYNMSMSIKIW